MLGVVGAWKTRVSKVAALEHLEDNPVIDKDRCEQCHLPWPMHAVNEATRERECHEMVSEQIRRWDLDDDD